MDSDKRRHVRVDVEVYVEVLVQINKKHEGYVTDISEAGLFVESGRYVAKSSFVVIRFSGQKIPFGATVRRVAQNGFGVEFRSTNDAYHEVILRFIPKLKQAKNASVVQMPTWMLLNRRDRI